MLSRQTTTLLALHAPLECRSVPASHKVTQVDIKIWDVAIKSSLVGQDTCHSVFFIDVMQVSVEAGDREPGVVEELSYFLRLTLALHQFGSVKGLASLSRLLLNLHARFVFNFDRGRRQLRHLLRVDERGRAIERNRSVVGRDCCPTFDDLDVCDGAIGSQVSGRVADGVLGAGRLETRTRALGALAVSIRQGHVEVWVTACGPADSHTGELALPD